MLTLDLTAAPADRTRTGNPDLALVRDRNLALVPLRGGLWRVTRTSGEVLGYVEEFEVGDGLRYRAKRVNSRLQRFIALGEFWRMDDAVECFVAS